MRQKAVRACTLLLAVMVAATVMLGTQSVTPRSAQDRGVEAAGPSAELTTEFTTVGSRRISRKFSQYRYFWVDRFNTCLGVWVTGTISAERVTQYTSEAFYVYLRKPRISNPYMLTTLKRSCDDNASYKTPTNVFRHTMMFYGYRCSFNPSFSVAFPWSVGASVTPDCGSEPTARYSQTQKRTGNAYRFELDTDGYAVGWNDRTGAIVSGTGDRVRLCTSLAGHFMLKDTKGEVRRTTYRKGGFKDVCISTGA